MNNADEPNGQPAPPAAEVPSVRRINRIAEHTGARSYLEIGVNTGRTFNGLTFDRKVAVDPIFHFNVAEFEKQGVEFHLLTSDQYFIRHGARQKFDIIFLDGLHKFQQTFRDFCNSLACAHDRTVWLIDDVVPVDVYSAWPVQREALKFRKRAGGDRSSWHGDVFKVMFAIHDFFPMLSYVTLSGKGNSQSVIWKAPRVDFSPVFDSLEAIERLGYFDMLNHESVLNIKPEQAAFEVFLASMEGQPPLHHPGDTAVR